MGCAPALFVPWIERTAQKLFVFQIIPIEVFQRAHCIVETPFLKYTIWWSGLKKNWRRPVIMHGVLPKLLSPSSTPPRPSLQVGNAHLLPEKKKKPINGFFPPSHAWCVTHLRWTWAGRTGCRTGRSWSSWGKRSWWWRCERSSGISAVQDVLWTLVPLPKLQGLVPEEFQGDLIVQGLVDVERSRKKSCYKLQIGPRYSPDHFSP